MSAVCVVSFYFITHSVIHPQLSEPFGSYRWALENDRGGGGEKQLKQNNTILKGKLLVFPGFFAQCQPEIKRSLEA